ncbi:MAG: DUF3999 family protein, partial [Candidatus Electrothrix sp. ATG2]|nr:DUF3999 family protein [Candidatus Electrothrix sp. ATG2]
MKLLREVMIDFAGYRRGKSLCLPFNDPPDFRAGTGACPYTLSSETGRLFFRNFFLLALLLFCGSPVQAAGAEDNTPLQRQDFAYGMDLTISGSNPIYGLTLPAEVYRGCTRANLGDLRVFNASHPVPHLLRIQVSKETKRAAQVLPFFPLLSERQGGSSS